MKHCIDKISHFFKEVKSFYLFYKRLDKSERDIVFYSEDASSYSYFEGLIYYLTEKKDLKICYITSDISDPILSQKRKNIKSFYIKLLLPFFTISLNSKLLIMTMPDLHRFHIRRSENGTHHVYLFHNAGSSFPVIRYGALFHYDTIFCVGTHHIEEIRRQEEIYNLPKKNLVRFGYYRIEKIYDSYKKYAHSKPCRRRILLAPSWGTSSILNICGSKLIRILLDFNYEIIVRPHSMTQKHNPQLLKALNKEFRGFDNYKFEDDIASLESILTSDILISDWSGIAYEYAFGTERPVLFIDIPQKILNPRYKDLCIEPIDVNIRKRIGTVLKIDDLEKIDATINYMNKNRDDYIKNILRAREDYVYNFMNSSQFGANFIYNFVSNGTIETE